MAYPFGNHPTLARYMMAATAAGFHAGTVAGGGVVISNADYSRWYIFSRMPQTERLTPAIVAQADRRLGWDSGFPKAEVSTAET